MHLELILRMELNFFQKLELYPFGMELIPAEWELTSLRLMDKLWNNEKHEKR